MDFINIINSLPSDIINNIYEYYNPYEAFYNITLMDIKNENLLIKDLYYKDYYYNEINNEFYNDENNRIKIINDNGLKQELKKTLYNELFTFHSEYMYKYRKNKKTLYNDFINLYDQIIEENEDFDIINKLLNEIIEFNKFFYGYCKEEGKENVINEWIGKYDNSYEINGIIKSVYIR